MNIEPCFCGNVPCVVNDLYTDNNGILCDSWYVSCKKCGMHDRGHYATEQEAIKTWNDALVAYRDYQEGRP